MQVESESSKKPGLLENVGGCRCDLLFLAGGLLPTLAGCHKLLLGDCINANGDCQHDKRC